MDKSKHRLYMAKILCSFFEDDILSKYISLKGGTSLMLFHGLSRFSTDLDFNLLDTSKEDIVFDRVKSILSKFGTIDDEAKKRSGPVIVLNYEKGERMLKIKISNRTYDNHYELLKLSETIISVMTIPDMFAHKLCAVGERLTPRDIFDICFFLKKGVPINSHIVLSRTGKSVSDYALICAEKIKTFSPKLLMQGLGELLDDDKSKAYARDVLIEEASKALRLFSSFPLLSDQEPTKRTVLLEQNSDFVEFVKANDIDISTMDDQAIVDILLNNMTLNFRNRYGINIQVGPKSTCKKKRGIKL